MITAKPSKLSPYEKAVSTSTSSVVFVDTACLGRTTSTTIVKVRNANGLFISSQNIRSAFDVMLHNSTAIC
jgi:hypothetical protein